MGIFSRNKGDDVSKKKRTSGEDETSINAGVEHAGDPEEADDAEPGSGEDETSINSGVDHAPSDTQAQLEGAVRAAVPQEEGESSEDYQRRLAILAGHPDTPTSGALPGNPERSSHTGNTQADEIVPPGAAGEGLPKDDFSSETRLARQRQYVIERGLLPQGEVLNLSDEELQAVYDKSIGTVGTAEPKTEVAVRPSQQAQAILFSGSRADKVALVTAKSNLTALQAEGLAPEDLDAQVRAVVAAELTLERAKEDREIEKVKPITDAPYGGDLPKYYAVTKGITFAAEGSVVQIRDGMVINDRSHNIDDLRARGAQLIETVAPTPQ